MEMKVSGCVITGFPGDLARRFVAADSQQPRVAQLAVRRPLDERDLNDDFRPNPVRADARHAFSLCKRRVRDFEFVETRAKIDQHSGVKTRADLSSKGKIVS